MPFDFQIINGSKMVCKIKYMCYNCEFTTFWQDEELEHGDSKDHFLVSIIDKQAVPYTERLHGKFPEWLK